MFRPTAADVANDMGQIMSAKLWISPLLSGNEVPMVASYP